MLEGHGQKYIKSYIAGFFDGEGCITAYFPKNSHDRVRCVITITNTNKQILTMIQKIYGGKIYKHGKINKQCFVLHLSMLNTMDFLYDICDYLIDKKVQAELAIEFLGYTTTNRGQWKDEIAEYYVNKISEAKR